MKITHVNKIDINWEPTTLPTGYILREIKVSKDWLNRNQLQDICNILKQSFNWSLRIQFSDNNENIFRSPSLPPKGPPLMRVNQSSGKLENIEVEDDAQAMYEKGIDRIVKGMNIINQTTCQISSITCDFNKDNKKLDLYTGLFVKESDMESLHEDFLKVVNTIDGIIQDIITRKPIVWSV